MKPPIGFFPPKTVQFLTNDHEEPLYFSFSTTAIHYSVCKIGSEIELSWSFQDLAVKYKMISYFEYEARISFWDKAGFLHLMQGHL
jgi:hypothetical protein